MDTITTAPTVNQLKERREQIAMTLRHLGKEQAEVERNTEWLNRKAYENRADLLTRLLKWYVSEIDEIDKALRRVTTSDR